MSDISDHGRLMDDTYRYQRLIYDLTRKYYLLGRDHLISNLDAKPGDRILEVACGTGRNLALIRKSYPEARLYGFDISQQMLSTARSKLGAEVSLAQGDACSFDPVTLFGVEAFDHIVLSYSLSMIPDWSGALREAQRHLAENGTLHVVDFGDCAGLPNWFRRALYGWLEKFHVTPRAKLGPALQSLAGGDEVAMFRHLYRGYAAYGQYRQKGLSSDQARAAQE